VEVTLDALEPPLIERFRHPDGVHEFRCVVNPELRFAALRALLRRASGALKGEFACFRKTSLPDRPSARVRMHDDHDAAIGALPFDLHLLFGALEWDRTRTRSYDKF